MTLDNLRTAIKDQSHDSGITDANLLTWINSGYQDVVNKLIDLYEGFFGSSDSISIVSGTQEYDLDSLCRKVVRVEDENSDKVFRVVIDDNDDDVCGYYLFAQKIGFKPVPTSSATYKYFFIKQPADLSEDDDEPVFPSSYHNLLVLWGLKEYYERNQDLSYATHYFNQYNMKLSELKNEMKNRNEDESKYARPRYKNDDDLEWQD